MPRRRNDCQLFPPRSVEAQGSFGSREAGADRPLSLRSRHLRRPRGRRRCGGKVVLHRPGKCPSAYPVPTHLPSVLMQVFSRESTRDLVTSAPRVGLRRPKCASPCHPTPLHPQRPPATHRACSRACPSCSRSPAWVAQPSTAGSPTARSHHRCVSDRAPWPGAGQTLISGPARAAAHH